MIVSLSPLKTKVIQDIRSMINATEDILSVRNTYTKSTSSVSQVEQDGALATPCSSIKDDNASDITLQFCSKLQYNVQ